MAWAGRGAIGIAAAAGMAALALAGASGAAETLRWQEPVRVAGVPDSCLLRLEDGRVVRLAGIRCPADDAEGAAAQRLAREARATLDGLLHRATIRLAPAEAAHDRYGRLVAQIERSDGLWLQGALLERGLAQVHTRPGEAARAHEMLAIEEAARAARRGLWGEAAFMVRDAAALDDGIGRFRIVRGRVHRVAPTERYVYLNFGEDWRTDFTVRLRRADLRGALAGLDPEALAGRLVEVRGVVLEAGGPLIELSHLEQMQVLP